MPFLPSFLFNAKNFIIKCDNYKTLHFTELRTNIIGMNNLGNNIENNKPEWKVVSENLDKISPKISEVSNFEELYSTIDGIGTIETSNEHIYTPEMLKNLIESIRNGEKPLKDLTRNAGLREKVEELLKKN